MDLKALKELVKQGEGKQLEFKLKSNHPERIVREIVAFANTNGGKLLIGIGDDRSVQGLKYADEDEYILVRAIEKHCTPIPNYTIARVHIGDEREVLIFDVPASQTPPHFVVYQDVTIQKKAYIRVADRAIQASREMKEILKRKSQHRNVSFHYGEKEQKLMQYLEENQTITLEDFAQIAVIPKKIASKTLILLVLANVLKVQPDEVADRFLRTL